MLAAKVGKGVTKEGQQIFDQLERQYDCRWHEKNIIVLDVVMITPPYTQESCRAKPEHANQLERVKKMLDNIRARMSDGSRLPEAGGPKGKVVPAIPASGQRKGG